MRRALKGRDNRAHAVTAISRKITPMADENHESTILGCLLGAAVGDAIGLPSEGMTRARIARRWNGLQHRLVFGKGMFSDDTEHTLMVATSLLEHGNNAMAFQRSLGWKLRWWLLALPAGVGLSTAKAILRLWLGFPAAKAGVRSAGNGAAMRSAILGVVFGDNAVERRTFVQAACRLTHTDPRAEESAVLVAEAALAAARQLPVDEVLTILRPLVLSEEMRERFAVLEASLPSGITVQDYAAAIHCERGVSGFAPNTVAVALYAWLRHRGQYETVVREVVACGGDTDTVAAIAGGICGAEVGETGIPREWIEDICDWPRSIAYIRKAASALANRDAPEPRLFWPTLLARNILFLLIVLCHGFRRLLPPY